MRTSLRLDLIMEYNDNNLYVHTHINIIMFSISKKVKITVSLEKKKFKLLAFFKFTSLDSNFEILQEILDNQICCL